MKDRMRETTIQFINQYFEIFLPSALGESIVAELDNLSIVLGFHITDSAEKWTIVLEQGRLKHIKKDPSEDPEVLFALGSETFLQIVSGALAPQKSFYTNRAKISGDTLKALKMASIFKRFIKEHPFATPGALESDV